MGRSQEKGWKVNMKRTDNYGWPYFEEGDKSNAIYEIQRWSAIDKQLYGMFQLFGNGVASGWDIVNLEGLSIGVSGGKGVVDFVPVETTGNTIMKLTTSSTNYIYANLLRDSYWTKSVKLTAATSRLNKSDRIYLGSVKTGVDSVEVIDIKGRDYIDSIDSVTRQIAEHKHVGGVNNPDQIDLSKNVKGILPEEHLPALRGEMINKGKIDIDRLPTINHDSLSGKGRLTHEQLDLIADSVEKDGPLKMGEMVVANMLKLCVRLKRKDNTIDRMLKNQIHFIPGANSLFKVDEESTTFDVGADITCKCDGNDKLFYTEYIDVDDPISHLMLTSSFDLDGDVSVKHGVSLVDSSNPDDFVYFSTEEFVNLKSNSNNSGLKILIVLSGHGSATINDFSVLYC